MSDAHRADNGHLADADRHVVKVRYAILDLFKGRFAIVLDDFPQGPVKRGPDPAKEDTVLEIAELSGRNTLGGL